jgi:hypothetical protein
MTEGQRSDKEIGRLPCFLDDIVKERFVEPGVNLDYTVAGAIEQFGHTVDQTWRAYSFDAAAAEVDARSSRCQEAEVNPWPSQDTPQ